MIIVPNNVKCRFCRKIFCCQNCCFKHEKNNHKEELEAEKEIERIQSLCYLCKGKKFPLGTQLPLQNEMLKHISEEHLPLKCGACSKIYENLDDLKNVDKCCSISVPTVEVESTESTSCVIEENLHNDSDSVLTPLSKINKRWRRKSKDFKDAGLLKPQEDKVQRTTSTPMQNDLLMTKTFIDSSNSASSIHISSINCYSTSSESDGFSPPVNLIAATVTPEAPKVQSVNRRSAKLPVSATPLRQVMTKSIQRAIELHGHYRQTPYVLQQRKMSFNSTNSSSEASSKSLMKFPTESDSPIDLRLSPAIRRFQSVATTETVEVVGQCEVPYENNTKNQESHIAIEHIEASIEVVIRRSKIKSDTTAMTSFNAYESCFSDCGQSASLPEIQFTPKISGNNMLKKTISFEAPGTIEKTPSFLMKACNKPEEENDEDDVFYTPRASPLKALRRVTVNNPTKPDLGDEPGDSENAFPSKCFWNFMKNVVEVARRTSEDISETLSNSDKIWKINLKKPEFVKKAAGLFASRVKNYYKVEQPTKRRRSSSSNSCSSSQTSPVVKRQKIQARRPIGEMRKLS